MSDFAKTTALFRSVIKQYECFYLESVEISDDIITVAFNLDTKTDTPHRLNLVVMLNSKNNILTMYTKVIFAFEHRDVSSILSAVNKAQFVAFEEDHICHPIYTGTSSDGKYHNFLVTSNQRFVGNFTNNRPDTDAVRSCEALINMFVAGYSIIFNTLHEEFCGEVAAYHRRRKMI